MLKKNEGNWRIEITEQIEKQIAKKERVDQERILFALCTLEKSGTHRQNVRQIKKRLEWVMRVGSWRIILRLDDESRKIIALNLSEKK